MKPACNFEIKCSFLKISFFRLITEIYHMEFYISKINEVEFLYKTAIFSSEIS